MSHRSPLTAGLSGFRVFQGDRRPFPASSRGTLPAPFGDCCTDYDQFCGLDPNSCLDNNACGAQAPGGCFCDTFCVVFGHCCSDGPC